MFMSSQQQQQHQQQQQQQQHQQQQQQQQQYQLCQSQQQATLNRGRDYYMFSFYSCCEKYHRYPDPKIKPYITLILLLCNKEVYIQD